MENFNKTIIELSRKINVEIDEQMCKQFYQYMKLLLEWNEKINLTAITEENEVILKHFIDSLTINKYIEEGETIIDIGTGAGFPGIPLAISKITSEYETLKEYDKKNEMYRISKKIVYIFSLVAFLLCFLFAKPLAKVILGDLTGGNTIEDVSFVIRCISFALLVVPLLSIYRGYLQGHKYIEASSKSQVIEQIVRIFFILVGSYLCIKVFHLKITYAVGISVFSCAIGAIVAYIYLIIKTKKSNVVKNNKKSLSEEERKEVIKKIIGYCIPFIIINISNSIYNTTDMILIIRGLTNLGYSAKDVETISSIFTTWGSKLITIVKAFATGLTISLIPSIVSAYVKKDMDKANYYFNNSLKVLLFIITPLTIFLSIFAKEIWYIFYGQSYYGPIIFKYIILVAILDSAYIIFFSALQGLYKTKLVYICALSGITVNALLDLPLMYLFNRMGIYPYYGAITATVIGYIISLSIPIVSLYKNDGFRYNDTIKSLPKLIFSILIAIFMCIIYKKIMPTFNGFIGNMLYLGIIGLLTLTVYFLINKDTIIKL